MIKARRRPAALAKASAEHWRQWQRYMLVARRMRASMYSPQKTPFTMRASKSRALSLLDYSNFPIPLSHSGWPPLAPARCHRTLCRPARTWPRSLPLAVLSAGATCGVRLQSRVQKQAQHKRKLEPCRSHATGPSYTPTRSRPPPRAASRLARRAPHGGPPSAARQLAPPAPLRQRCRQPAVYWVPDTMSESPASVMVSTHTRCSLPQAVPRSTLLPE